MICRYYDDDVVFGNILNGCDTYFADLMMVSLQCLATFWMAVMALAGDLQHFVWKWCVFCRPDIKVLSNILNGCNMYFADLTVMSWHLASVWMAVTCILQTWCWCPYSVWQHSEWLWWPGYDWQHFEWMWFVLCWLLVDVVFGNILNQMVVMCMLQTSRRPLLCCWKASWLAWTG